MASDKMAARTLCRTFEELHRVSNCFCLQIRNDFPWKVCSCSIPLSTQKDGITQTDSTFSLIPVQIYFLLNWSVTCSIFVCICFAHITQADTNRWPKKRKIRRIKKESCSLVLLKYLIAFNWSSCTSKSRMWDKRWETTKEKLSHWKNTSLKLCCNAIEPVFALIS